MAERPMVGARVDLETKQQLESIAQRLGSTPSRLIAELIADYLDQERANPTVNAFELLQVTLESLKTQLAAANREQVALLSQQLDGVQSSLQEVLAALAKPPQSIQPLPVPPQVDSKPFCAQHQRVKDLAVAIPGAVESGHQSHVATPDPPSQDHSVEIPKTKTERVKGIKQAKFCYDLKQLAVHFSLKEAEWAEWEVALAQADFIHKLEQRTKVAWCAVDAVLPGLYYQDSGFFN